MEVFEIVIALLLGGAVLAAASRRAVPIAGGARQRGARPPSP
jgi:hypothetical protein